MSIPVAGGSSYYAGAVVPYAQPGPPALQSAPNEVDVYEPSGDAGEYRFADTEEMNTARRALLDILDYYADHLLWGRPVFYTKSSVAERFRNVLRNMVTSEVLFDPEPIFQVLTVHDSRHVKSTKSHFQNLFVDRNKDETKQQRDSRMELEVLRVWAKCVVEVTNDQTDNPNARALCAYAEYLIEGAQGVLYHSNGNWAKKMHSRFESLRVSLQETANNNELAYRDIYGD